MPRLKIFTVVSFNEKLERWSIKCTSRETKVDRDRGAQRFLLYLLGEAW
jgi:hypothetical protein